MVDEEEAPPEQVEEEQAPPVVEEDAQPRSFEELSPLNNATEVLSELTPVDLISSIFQSRDRLNKEDTFFLKRVLYFVGSLSF